MAVELEIEAGIATVTINRPDALNALSSAVIVELDAAVSELESSDAIRAAIVTGAGRAFVAGADIEQISKLDSTTGRDFARGGLARMRNRP